MDEFEILNRELRHLRSHVKIDVAGIHGISLVDCM